MQAEEFIREIQKGLLLWYYFKPGSTVLYIGNEQDALAEALAAHGLQAAYADCGQICEAAWQQEYAASFDYIVCIALLEQQSSPETVLRILRKLLKEGGTMLLGMNNRYGIRYFCGDRDPYTDRNFDGITDYCQAYSAEEDTFRGRCYSQAELKRMLHHAGWQTCRFYAVLPDLKNPCLIYADGCLPNEDLASRLFPMYNCPDVVFLEEQTLYNGLADSGLFHKLANAYLIECPAGNNLSDVSHVTSSMERGRERAFFTIMHKDRTVEKRAAYPEGQAQLKKLVRHGQDLAAHGIAVVDARIESGACIMPYIHAESGQVYLKKLLLADKGQFLQEMDRFRDLILQSSEIVKPDIGDGQGAILRRGYLDMVPLNSFHMDGTFVFYDQEFCEYNYPANAVIFRMITTFYAGAKEWQGMLPKDILFKRYGLSQNLERWQRMNREFLSSLRNERLLRVYHEKHRHNLGVVHSNRQRINYPLEEYRRLFMDIFRHADTRKLVLFGSGSYAKKFFALYQRDYPVYAVIDNNEDKWGLELSGVKIYPPQFLGQLQPEEYKILICIKNYLSAMKQLDAMGVEEYSIYDPQQVHEIKRKTAIQLRERAMHPAGSKAARKKYRTGYIAGVFDLFHVGHLNMFKRAKEQCDYLIVGVVTDEGVRKNKKTEPFIPFEERIEMVRSCRYVDEAVEIPLNYAGTRVAYRLYHFDCQFSGSDYMDNPDWLAEKEFLEKQGAEMVFFPYTESTSSTSIKALIKKKLL